MSICPVAEEKTDIDAPVIRSFSRHESSAACNSACVVAICASETEFSDTLPVSAPPLEPASPSLPESGQPVNADTASMRTKTDTADFASVVGIARFRAKRSMLTKPYSPDWRLSRERARKRS